MPGPLGRIWGWLKRLVGGRHRGAGSHVKGRDPRPFLAGQAPGLWSANHLAEASQVTGWNFVAIRTMARMAASAETSVHELVNARLERRQLRSQLRFSLAIGDRRGINRLRKRLLTLKASAPTAQGTKQERRPVGHDDPLLNLLQHPNPNWSGSILRYQAIQQLAATGTAILWVVKNKLGIPAELYVVPTGLCIPRQPSEEFPQGSYWITPLSSWGLAPLNQDGWVTGAMGSALLTGAEIDARDVKPVRWPHPLYLSDGLSTPSAITMWIDVSNEMDRSCWYGLQNTERPGMVFTQDPEIDPDPADKDQFRDDLAAEHAGTPNTGKHLLLPKGILSTDRGRLPAEMDYQNGRPAYRDAVLAAHGVSPVAAGIVGAGSYSQFWAAIKQTTEIAVQPMLDLLGEDMTELLGRCWIEARREVTFKARAIDDPQLLENRLATDTRAGNVLLVKEYRAMRGQQPFGDERDNAFAGAGMQKPEGKPSEGEREDGDSTASDRGTGTREERRDAPPGRQDLNGKSHGKNRVNGYLKDAGHKPAGSPEGGQFTGDGDSGGSGGSKDSGGTATATKPAHHATVQSWLDRADLPEETKTAYHKTTTAVLDTMPEGCRKAALEAIAEHGGKATFYGSIKEVTGALEKENGKKERGPVGGWVKQHPNGDAVQLHLDGGAAEVGADSAEGITAHELGHCVDAGRRYSEDPKWEAAWAKEIKKGKNAISRYALTSATEGFAELHRAIVQRGLDSVRVAFPKCVAFLTAKGLV